jgi:hypothetical protein
VHLENNFTTKLGGRQTATGNKNLKAKGKRQKAKVKKIRPQEDKYMF